MAPVASAFEIGQAVSHYRLTGYIGSGGMSVLYKAKDTVLGRTVALKFPSHAMRRDAIMLDRFRREARTASVLSHPNICTLYEVGEYDGCPFLAMEYLEGHNLRDVISDHGLNAEKLLDYALQIASGLEAAHGKEIVHRDLKPGNIFITKDGFAKILDFGLARLGPSHGVAPMQTTADEEPLTGPGTVMGTVAYMSPEQTLARELDPRSDLFSFGVVLYEMATGVQPFRGDSSSAVIDAILHSVPVAPVRLNPELPMELERIIHNCLEKDRETRYQNATAICADLRRLKREASSGQLAILAAKPGRRRWPRYAMTGVAATATLAAAWMLWTSAPPVPEVNSIDPITHDGLLKAGPLSDGKRVYFLEMSQNRPLVAEVAATGGESREVVTPFQKNQLLDIAPDGSKLLVCENAVTAPTCPFWTLDLPAGTPRRLDNLEGQDAAWSPDGKRLIFSSRSEIWSAEGNGTDPRKLLTVTGFPFGARLSPDGARIRYTIEGTDGTDALWEAKADGSGAHRLLPGWRAPSQDWGGIWSPNGRYYAFLHGDGENGDLWVLPEKRRWMRGARAMPVQLTAGPVGFTDLNFSPDGKTVLAAGQLFRGQLVRYDPATRQMTPFLGGVSAGDLAFSKDGRWMAYATYPEGALWRCRMDGSERLELTGSHASRPSWSPDGRHIAFSSTAGQGRASKLYLISADGGAPEQILAEGEDENNPTWSSDGKQIIFARTPELAGVERIELLRVDIETKRVTPVPGSEGLFSPRWSPDGRFLAALSGDSRQLLLFDFQKHAWTTWFTPEEGFVEWEKWSADSRSLSFAVEKTGHFSEWRIGLEQRAPEMIVDLSFEQRYEGPGARGGWIGVAPDGSVLFTRDLSHHEIYALHLNRE
ncbi:MAG: protein kinase domain-containing protein [Acidobacteriota bacterium]